MKDFGADLEFSALLLYFVDQRMAHLAIIHDAGGGNAKRSDAGNMRFHFFYFFRTEPHRRHAVLQHLGQVARGRLGIEPLEARFAPN